VDDVCLEIVNVIAWIQDINAAVEMEEDRVTTTTAAAATTTTTTITTNAWMPFPDTDTSSIHSSIV